MELFKAFEPEPHSATDCRFFLYGCSVGVADLTLLKQFQTQLAPLYFDLTVAQRLEAVRVYSCSGSSVHHPDPSIFKFLLRDDAAFRPEDLGAFSEGRYSLTHSAVICFARAYWKHHVSNKTFETQIAGWQALIFELLCLSNSKTIHHIEDVKHNYSLSIGTLITQDVWNGSPLLSLLKGSFLDTFNGGVSGVQNVQALARRHMSMVSNLIKEWVRLLDKSGVDLGAYMEREKQTCTNTASLDFDLKYSRWCVSEQYLLVEKLPVLVQKLNFNDSIDHFSVDWMIDNEKLVGDFWEMARIDYSPVTQMPGTWVD